MEKQPKTIKETDHMKNVGRFILPTKDKNQIINGNNNVKTVTKENVERPKLGF